MINASSLVFLLKINLEIDNCILIVFDLFPIDSSYGFYEIYGFINTGVNLTSDYYHFMIYPST